MQKIAVLDYGMGNLHSVASALQRVAPDEEVVLAGKPEEAQGADRLLVPGVGAIRDCMAGFTDAGFTPLLKDAIDSGLPVLGICVGMQIMMHHSEENGGVDCLDIFPQPVKFFGSCLEENGERLKVPHMGWNRVAQKRPHPLWRDIDDGDRFYFVHSYYVPADGNGEIAGQTEYGVSLAAAVARQNIFATQFHPEKSARSGLQLLKNFVGWNGHV
ncbi:imidazole glycerol phosphate synthase subunit HisH [Microbulbifer thermotolerans]|uniref:Imidazole glycerol phosphate synthase subunit HisH n=1 Tax=Microbulbifer thermotolerans TaxID=252514 RepID=A0A143HPR3_MICTH|nr:imidazole glycerol phosphate synthase subunit HisH [Microbulbifer thermotolerans]AMX03709.1 imidazole glycerol phosphate synthase subunit HisH [Microbulbifer thermotolerans]MCX2781058.1 imidazole glycerol phosphate synthase subunit HisH [Microbulbifer thermotolerans]MCX2783631.1 imidazole glycerol phosphate synthase subunit HisH [Microbulbifer thermotolerans]MCX2796228.1 imidazole glycerol phosphate synthase subunit HisH [Microbulbifer thermotolerans]MCX2803226.1 imidazole glycerol phosphat